MTGKRGIIAAGFITIVMAVFVTVLVGAILANPVGSAVNNINTTTINSTGGYSANSSLVNIIPNVTVLYVLMLLLVPVVGVMALSAIIS